MGLFRRWAVCTSAVSFTLLAVVSACAGSQAANGSAPAPAGDPGRGAALFTSEARPPCATCHAIQGVSTGQVGPDLTRIGAEASDRIDEPGYTGSAADAAGYLRESILTPNAFIAPACPGGPCYKNIMPQDFGQTLSEQQVDDLVAFLLSQR